MSKPRPGVEAGKRLFQCNDIKVWQLVEAQHDAHIVEQVKTLQQVDKQYRSLGQILEGSSKTFITTVELLLVVKWKFLVGKPRPALMKHLHSNSESDVQKHSTTAFEIARSLPESNGDTKSSNEVTAGTKKALEALMNLKGVGPATASAILALVRPDIFGYMYDESIESCGLKRAYNLATYLKLNDHCVTIAANLGNGWTPSRVARAMWTASRAQAHQLDDHTLTLDSSNGKRKMQEIEKKNHGKRRRVAKA